MSSKLTTLPSTLEMTFWVTTRMSPSSMGVPWVAAASIIRPARSSPGPSSGILFNADNANFRRHSDSPRN